ncbi:hypothetical protein FHX75_11614 [Micromonospora palomenae]|uniref:Uncharacterized protein n=1 Tax=Micromonospora palomenae TaxID=1461247 RepID=A0A561WUC5_9ACTN|nr:hypothetical protein [Micromonospora palomenae]TWG27476.1 hypothetical protein FHX75_11614 [Micromonospora palomenae]
MFRDLLDSIATATYGDLVGLKLRDTAAVRLAMIPEDELPVWRAYAGTYMRDDGKALLDQALEEIGAVNDTRRGYESLFWGLLEDLRRALERRGQATAAVPLFQDPPTAGDTLDA